MDCSPPGSSVHRIFQARILEWVAYTILILPIQGDAASFGLPWSFFVKYALFFLVAQDLAAMQETWVRYLSWEDSLEKGMAAHSSILARRSPWAEEPGGLSSMGLQRVGHD